VRAKKASGEGEGVQGYFIALTLFLTLSLALPLRTLDLFRFLRFDGP